VNNEESSASEAQNLRAEVIMCCHTPEGAAIRQHGKWWIHEQTEKTMENWRKIFTCGNSFTLNPT